MSNMSYCRFRNTQPDLEDCVEALEDIDFNLAELSKEERSSADALIQLCIRVAQQAGDTPPVEQQAASSAVLKAIREANMQLVRTGDDAFMLVPYKVATTEAAAPKAGVTTGAALGGVYAELPAPLLIQYDEIDCEEFGCFAEGQMRDFADRTHALRMQAATKAAPVTQQAGYTEVIECGNSYAKVKLKGEAFGSTRVGDIFYTALQQDEPVGEVVSASCDHATVRWLHQTSSVGSGDPRNSRAWPKVSGVSRDEGHSRALLVFFAAEPTDDEMRAVHDTLAASPTPPAEQPAPNTGHAEADRLIGRLMSSDPDFEDCRQAAELIQREIKGPDGFGTWREAAIAERLTRVNQQAAPKATTQQEVQEPCPTCDSADGYNGPYQFHDDKAVEAAITAARARLGERRNAS